jgi:hypothetical protein
MALAAFLDRVGVGCRACNCKLALRQSLIDKGVRRSVAAFWLTVLDGALIVGPLLVLAVQMAREAGVIIQGFRDLKENGLGTPEWVSVVIFPLKLITAWALIFAPYGGGLLFHEFDGAPC